MYMDDVTELCSFIKTTFFSGVEPFWTRSNVNEFVLKRMALFIFYYRFKLFVIVLFNKVFISTIFYITRILLKYYKIKF